jgi:putative hydrolase of the HAD superfamily
LSFVHDIDLSLIPPNPELGQILGLLPGRKFVFTNGSVRHAERVMERIGIATHFSAVFDIEAADFIPKPAPETMDAFIGHLSIEPRRAAMFDDIAANLVPAHARGMKTVWIKTQKSWAADPAQSVGPYVHYETEDLTRFLADGVIARD